MVPRALNPKCGGWHSPPARLRDEEGRLCAQREQQQVQGIDSPKVQSPREPDQRGEWETQSGARAGLKLIAKKHLEFSLHSACPVSCFLRDSAYMRGGRRWLNTVGLSSLRMSESSVHPTGTWPPCYDPGQDLLNRIPGQVVRNQTEAQAWSVAGSSPQHLWTTDRRQALNAGCSAHELRNLGHVTSPLWVLVALLRQGHGNYSVVL